MLQKITKRCFLIFTLIFLSCSSNPYPTDERLSQHFKENRRDFEKLIDMFQNDRQLLRLDLDGEIRFEEGGKITKNNLVGYYALLSKLNLKSISRNNDKKEIYLLAWESKYLFIGGKFKFYFYSEENQTGLVNSLDEIYYEGRDAYALSKIEENWYLLLDVW